MLFKSPLVFVSTLVVSIAFAAPTDPASPPAENSTAAANTNPLTTLASASSAVTTIDGILFSMDPHMITPSTILAPLPVASAVPLSPVITETTVEIITTTITEAPVTITVSAPPSTVTNIITATPSPSPSLSTVPSPPPPPTPAQQTTWTAPAQMTDLSAFNISAFPGGQRNMNIVNGIPAGASATSLADDAASTSPADLIAAALTSWDNSSSVLQLFYPENSIDPASKPQGGAEFYATPLSIQHANTVSLEYSVFFPVDYDWVLGGKLPGLYGGHTGCSGGNNALTCFSTRLMWRPGGMGELYLVSSAIYSHMPF